MLLLGALTLAAGACGDDDASGNDDDGGDDDDQGTEVDASPAPDAGSQNDAAPPPDAAVPTSVSFVGLGNNVACAVLSNGAVRCWGNNDQKQLGPETLADDVNVRLRPSPVEVTGLTNAVSVDCGTATCCALTQTGGVQCWGWNDQGVLGGNTAEGNRAAPGAVLEEVRPGQIAELSGADQLSVGGVHACINKDGTVSCWGWNADGQLGLALSEPNALVAKENGVTGVTAIAVGHPHFARHSCAIRTAGVECWGRSDEGQLGRGASTGPQPPALVPGLVQATALSAGQNHTCAIARATTPANSDPAVHCWGQNNFAQTGRPATDPLTLEPAAVAGLAGATALAAGQSHTCALLNTGNVRCWGANNFGQLGNNTVGDPQATPTVVVSPDGTGMLTNVAQIAAGFGNTCARTTAGRVFCWGDNVVGQLGQGSSGADQAPRPVPIEVPILP